MNLALPFPEADDSALDDCVAAMDEELDVQFLGEVDGVLRRIRPDPEVPADAAVA